MTLGEVIKDVLARRNPDGSRMWTQRTLAAKLGTTQAAISQMLTGEGWNAHYQVFKRLLRLIDQIEKE